MKHRPTVLPVLALTSMWLLLNGTVATGQILLGLFVSLLVVAGSRAVGQPQLRFHRPLLAMLLLWRVFVDILRSNVAVARIVLGLHGQQTIRSAFLEVPLAMRDPHGLAALATIVTSTPGTIWVDLSHDGATLTLHVLDLRDEQAWISIITQRYERLLMEIFE